MGYGCGGAGAVLTLRPLGTVYVGLRALAARARYCGRRAERTDCCYSGAVTRDREENKKLRSHQPSPSTAFTL